MFNLRPGSGMGTEPSGVIVFGLGSLIAEETVSIVVEQPVRVGSSGGGGGGKERPEYKVHKKKVDRRGPEHDIHRDDEEVLELLIQMIAAGILD